MRRSFFSLLACGLLFISCKDSGSPAITETTVATKSTPPPAPQSNLGQEATSGLMDMLTAYYSLKDAMVASSGAKADAAASRLLSSAETFNNSLGSKPQYTSLKPELQSIMKGSEAIIAAKGDSIEQKRAHFSDVSEAMYAIVTAAKLQHAGIYHQYCPMALADKGAYWLSAESEIRNPYFGKKMLECGEVRDSL